MRSESTEAASMLDLDDLRLVVVLADELHFGRAAARLHLSQPGLSYRLKRMEDQLGYGLVQRTRRSVELTAAGQVVLDGAHRVLGEAQRLMDDGRRVARGELATLRFGFVGTALYSLLPTVLRALRRRHPEIRLLVEEMKTAEQVRKLTLGHLDLGLAHLPLAATANLESVVVTSDRVGLALPDDHRLAASESIALRDVSGDPFVLFPPELEPQTYERYVGACVTAGFAPRVVHQATGLQTILGLVAAGEGVAFVAASVARNLARSGVVFRPIDGDAPVLTCGPAWRAGDAKPAVATLRDLIVEVAGSIDQ